jgi:orotate phosphoribosyltransferase
MPSKNSIATKTAEILLDIEAVKFNIDQPFKLTSGKKSPVYCDCRKIISFPKERKILIKFAVEILKNQKFFKNIDVIAGGETAGIPFASFISSKLDLSMVYIRKETKKFGRKKKIEGLLKKNQKVILVEDLITDGGSKVDFIKSLLDEKSKILCMFVIFNYGIFNKAFNLSGLRTKLLYLTSWREVLVVAKKKKILTSNNYNKVKSFLKDFGVKN